MMEYKGYVGVAEVDDEAGFIFGRVLGLRDVITFQGETVAEARQAFQDSVDDYLEFCARRGEDPEKSYSGKFVVRVKPELHRALVQAAEVSEMSLNALVEGVLEDRFLAPASRPPARPAVGAASAPKAGRSRARRPRRKGAG
jgi:predicted HicB family RNase H-like nuclease